MLKQKFRTWKKRSTDGDGDSVSSSTPTTTKETTTNSLGKPEQTRPRLRASFAQVPSTRKDITGSTTSTSTSLHLKLEETSMNLPQSLEAAAMLLGTIQDESQLTDAEIQLGLKVFHELQRVLSRNTRKGDWMTKASTFSHETPFRERYQALIAEFDESEKNVAKALAGAAAVQPLSLESIQDVNDFFILDNSLRETTVGAARGHTLQEKHKIIEALAETGLEEIILGSYGSKVSVDSLIAEQWKNLGKSFDATWGFSDVYDFEPFDEDRLWEADADYVNKEAKCDAADYYYTPTMVPKQKYSKKDLKLLQRASSGFRPDAFRGKRFKKVLKISESENGRIPLGLQMMAGYGICNAIIEVDASLETFDYQTFDIVERCKFLIKWIKKNFAKRKVPEGEDDTARVLVNLRDFSNYHRSDGGTEEALRLVDALSRLPPEERPFGFMMEEPTGWLFPSEVGRLCRMVRLTMSRAGFPQGRFLVHVHWYFGLAEASQLAALCNGADGVWAAVCKTGAQTGHACSTMTAVNLYRAGMSSICDKYDLEKMCQAAREVTEISSRAPCPVHEEIYGSQAFDIPYFMVNLPSCRYSIYHVLSKIGVSDRAIRLNEISPLSSVYRAMVYHFGPPDETGWDESQCPRMWDAIHNHLLSGLSRDYNSALGLGHLYGLVSKKKLPWAMVQVMTEQCNIPDSHPVVLDFVYRWNRLCALYEGTEVEPHPAAISKSMMFWGVPAVTEPSRESLPFEFFTADVMRNPVLEQIPRLFKLQVVNMLTKDERKVQGKRVPEVNFYEMILRLKLFIEEADSLNVLGLVDDFCIRKNHDYFFGEDHLWLHEVNKDRSGVANKLLKGHMKYYSKHYIQKGNTAITRCIESTALRIDEQRITIPKDMQDTFRRKSAVAMIYAIAENKRASDGTHDKALRGKSAECIMAPAHEKLLRELAEDRGQDEALAQQYLDETMEVLGLDDLDTAVKEEESLATAYIRERRKSLLKDDDASDSTMSNARRPSVGLDMIVKGGPLLLKAIQETITEDNMAIADDDASEASLSSMDDEASQDCEYSEDE